MLARLSALLKLVAAVALILVLIDAVVFRSGWYAPWMEMDSTAGATVSNVLAIRHYTDPSRRNVLVLGDSRVAEGLSAPTADAALGNGDLHFVNAAIPGTSPRVWNYLLRKIDRAVNRYAAIVLMVDYGPTWGGSFADSPLDTSHLTPLLRLTDFFDYPASFHDADERERARRAILLPLQAIRLDVLDFVAQPTKRLDEIHDTRPIWIDVLNKYEGHKEALPDLPIDAATGMPNDWGTDAATLKPKLESYFSDLRTPVDPATIEANIDYEREWVGRIAARYRAHGIPVIVFNIPRGPWHGSLVAPPQPNRALLELARAGSIDLLPGDAFVQFEKPQFFFDTLHMNHAGREAFSALLARKIAPLVH
ncbi:MAG: hypothetical protein QM741_01320 [Rudaea sp.]|uniref:hypothetical protein n=1 Tax=Rudaea sp. TaxID=2136325 RepID=UPI0039E480D5